ncbi:phlebovirus glycoprotein G1 [Ostertagia ostertagi]
MTRSKSRLNPMLLCLSIFMLLFQPSLMIDTRCPEGTNINKTILYASNCVSKGIAIAKYTDTDKETMCWFPVICPVGHIRFELLSTYSRPSRSTLCGETCQCPNWTTSCSYSRKSTGIPSRTSVLLSTVLEMRFCEETGDVQPNTIIRQQLLLVKEITVSIKDYLDKYDFICIDKKGWRRHLLGRLLTGTSYFCEKHKCHTNAKLFCTYDNPIAVYVTNDTANIFKGNIPIKAWGPVIKSYYEYPTTSRLPDTNNNRGLIGLHENTSLTASCMKGGLDLKCQRSNDVVEACSNHYCIFAKCPHNYLTFPNSIIMYDYKVRIKVWHRGELVYENELHCHAQPICETLQCLFCWERFYNTQCWTAIQIALFLSTFILCVFLIRCTCLLLKGLRWVIMSILRCISAIILRKKKQNKLRSYTSRRRKHGLILTLVTVVLQFSITNACSQVVTLTAHENTCSSSDGIEKCTFNEITVITLQPLQQESCLTLRNDHHQAIATVSIRIDGIKFRCNQNIEFFTRDHKLVAESIHRCYLAGSCVEKACDQISPQHQLKEFSNLAIRSPGYTFCEKSCGCWTCDGCFFCHPSCLFYRIFAIPRTEEVYTVFKCPSWEMVVDADVSILDSKTTLTTKLRLTPGRSIAWNNLRFSLIGTTVPQLPVLSSTFIKARNRVSIIKAASKGQLIANSAGQLQCSTIEDAKNFRCQFSSSICQCTHGIRSVSCVCPQLDMSKIINAKPLPQISKNFMIFSEQDTIYAKASVGSALQLHIVAENLKITSRSSNSTCAIETGDLIGCYNCFTGAELSVSVKAVREKSQQIWNVLRCTTKGHLNKIRLHFQSPTVSQSCLVSCPGGSTNITIKGMLQFSNENLLTEDASLQNRAGRTTESSLFFQKFPSMVLNFFKKIPQFFSSLSMVINFIIFLVLLFFILSICKTTDTLLGSFCSGTHQNKKSL